MDVVKELAELKAVFSSLQADGVHCEAIGYYLDGVPTTWVTQHFATPDQRELIREYCRRAGALVCAIHGHESSDLVGRWCDELEYTPLGPSNNIEDDKVVGHTWYHKIERLVDASAKRLADLLVEYRAKSAGERASQAADISLSQAATAPAKPVHDSVEFPAVSWTQGDVNAAIAIDIQKNGDAIQAARAGAKGAKKSLRKMYTKAATAERIATDRRTSIVPHTQVLKCDAWNSLRNDLGLGRSKLAARKKVGMEIALEEECESTGDTTANEIAVNDAIDAVRRSGELDSDAKQAMIASLRDGTFTADKAFAYLEMAQNAV
jgi:hypothetical protein